MPTENINALQQFLQWGPLGLAGLMLVLVVIALALDITAQRAGLLKFFMVIGALCFVAALLFQYLKPEGELSLRLAVYPNDLIDSPFPEPEIKLNGRSIDYRNEPLVLTGASSIDVDVTRAVGLFQQAEARIETQAEALTQARTFANSLSSQLERLRADPAVRLPQRELQQFQTIERVLFNILRSTE